MYVCGTVGHVAYVDAIYMCVWTRHILVVHDGIKKPPNLERLGGAFYTAQRMLGIVIAGCRLPRFTPS